MRLTVRDEQSRGHPSTRYGSPWVESHYDVDPPDAIGPSITVLNALVGSRVAPSSENGRAAVAALVGAYLSNENGHRPVRLDGDLPLRRVFQWA